jgi:Tfp pilus assembly protein PilN
VKAVNLIPVEERGRHGAQGGSPLAAYGLLAALALVLGAVVIYVLTANSVTDREGELADLKAQNVGARAKASELAPYVEFAELERDRVGTVRSLAASRFDWDRVMTDMSHVIGRRVWLTSLTATVTPDVAVASGSGADASSLRSALPNPAVQLGGCATSHREVIRFVSRLRATKRVVRVTLGDSEKPDTQTSAVSSDGDASSASGTPSDCGSPHHPKFDLVVFYTALPGVPSTGGGSGTSTTAAQGAPPSAPGSTTSSSTTATTTTPSTTTSTPTTPSPAPVSGGSG